MLRKIEECDDDAEWKRVEKKLYSEFSELEKDQRKYGDYSTGRQVELFRTQLNDVVKRKAIKEADALTEQIHRLDYQIAEIEYLIGNLNYFKNKFNSIMWVDTARARELLNEGFTIIGSDPTADKLRPIANELFDLLPPDNPPVLDIHVLRG